jgi:hypothetical protein
MPLNTENVNGKLKRPIYSDALFIKAPFFVPF